jgi:hypothetical protein
MSGGGVWWVGADKNLPGKIIMKHNCFDANIYAHPT